MILTIYLFSANNERRCKSQATVQCEISAVDFTDVIRPGEEESVLQQIWTEQNPNTIQGGVFNPEMANGGLWVQEIELCMA